MKKRTLTISLIVLAIMLLVGIGYASWTIARGDINSATGNFSAYAVQDDGALIVENFDNQVTFGQKDNETPIANPWLTLPDENSAEDLVATFKVKWSGGAQKFDLTHTFQYGETATTAPVDAKLVVAPVYALSSEVNGVTCSSTGLLEFTDGYTPYVEVVIKVTYAFGDIFGGTNPYIFFNTKSVSGKAFAESDDHVYNSGSLTLVQVNTALGLNGTAALNENSTYADVASAALTKLKAVVDGSGTALTFKVAVAKHPNA